MLYLEDYLESIEHLPNELRDRFTEIRELDLGVENQVDSLEARQNAFFAGASEMEESEREETYQKIRKDYMKVVEEAGEKSQIAEQCYSLVDRHLRKLDQEQEKFQLELEADHRGITEVLEKRSLEWDLPSSRPSSRKENRLPKKRKNTTIAHSPPREQIEALVDVKEEVTYPLQQMGSSGSAIAAAASQAIAATQLVPGRRSSSLKASFEAINLGVARDEFSIGRDLAGAATAALSATTTESAGGGLGISKILAMRKQKNEKIKTQKSEGGMSGLGSLMEEIDQVVEAGHMIPSPPSPSPGVPVADAQYSEQEWLQMQDPNEPRYCICNQVSYGDMVGCDNDDCPYEWFHYPCVGITAPPKGKWYCPPCIANIRRRGRK